MNFSMFVFNIVHLLIVLWWIALIRRNYFFSKKILMIYKRFVKNLISLWRRFIKEFFLCERTILNYSQMSQIESKRSRPIIGIGITREWESFWNGIQFDENGKHFHREILNSIQEALWLSRIICNFSKVIEWN